ncbi:MAG: hypothetical protein ABJA83_00630 [Burkholderiaceae bacterium]
MFNLCSLMPRSARLQFATMGGGRAMSVTGVVAFSAGQQLFGAAVLRIDPSGGSGV